MLIEEKKWVKKRLSTQVTLTVEEDLSSSDEEPIEQSKDIMSKLITSETKQSSKTNKKASSNITSHMDKNALANLIPSKIDHIKIMPHLWLNSLDMAPHQ